MKLQAVILDWAGTVVDFGSRGPVATLQKVFEDAGVSISVTEARQSMGIAKKSHIASILEIPRVKAEWTRLHRVPPSPSALSELYAAFVPQQIECLKQHADLIPGVAEMARSLQSRGVKIGSTTGYTRPMLDYLLDRARRQSFEPDASVCPDEVSAGRPAPWMCYLNAVLLRVDPLWAMVKIGDTPSDIEEGLNAGMWTIGITRTGNETGLTEAEWDAAPEAERSAILTAAETRLREAGAHYIAPSVAECDQAIAEIEELIESGERPDTLKKTLAADERG
ncbi:MAG: phosphonoacetaldehyde hydrolase [Bryobacteraceae bacterium]|jgi:phosphonoacetaldehyde hydrolase